MAQKSHGNEQDRAHGGRNAVASVRALFSLSSPNEETRVAWEAARGIWRSQRSHGDRACGRERVSAGVRSLNFIGPCWAWSGLLSSLFPRTLPNERFSRQNHQPKQSETNLNKPRQTFCTPGGEGVSGQKSPQFSSAYVNLCQAMSTYVNQFGPPFFCGQHSLAIWRPPAFRCLRCLRIRVYLCPSVVKKSAKIKGIAPKSYRHAPKNMKPSRAPPQPRLDDLPYYT